MHIVTSPNGLCIGKREIELQFEYYKRPEYTTEREGAGTSIIIQILSSEVPSFYSIFPALLIDAGIWKGEPGG